MRSPLPRSSSTRPTAAPSPLGFIDRPGGRGGRADLTTGPLGGISHRTSSLIPRPPSACITLDRPRAQPHSTQFTCPRNRIKAKGQQADSEVTPRNQRECEAESVALLCCAALDLPGVDECRGYIQNWWGQGNPIPERSAQRILKTADQILKAGTTDATKGGR